MEKKTDWLCECGKKYTYRVFENENDDMTFKVQNTKDFYAIRPFANFALVTVSRTFYCHMTTDDINSVLRRLVNKIEEDGYYGEIVENWNSKKIRIKGEQA